MTMKEWPGPCLICKKSTSYKKEQEKKLKEMLKKGNKAPFTFTGKKVADDITHFVKDESGKSFGVDVKGRLHSDTETRYDLKNDKHGWKATGVEKNK